VLLLSGLLFIKPGILCVILPYFESSIEVLVLGLLVFETTILCDQFTVVEYSYFVKIVILIVILLSKFV